LESLSPVQLCGVLKIVLRFENDETMQFPSGQVFEHVSDRVSGDPLRAGGLRIHGAKWQIIEQHRYVPFGGLISFIPIIFVKVELEINDKRIGEKWEDLVQISSYKQARRSNISSNIREISVINSSDQNACSMRIISLKMT
jgi:hypothetical protein